MLANVWVPVTSGTFRQIEDNQVYAAAAARGSIKSASWGSRAMAQLRYTLNALQELSAQAASQEWRRIVASYGALEGLRIRCRYPVSKSVDHRFLANNT